MDDILVAVRFLQLKVQPQNLVAVSQLDDLPGDQALEHVARRYAWNRGSDLVHHEENGSTFVADIATIMVDLARPGVIFPDKATPIAAKLGTGLLLRQGWRTELNDKQWFTLIDNLSLDAGALRGYEQAVRKNWHPTDIVSNQLFAKAHNWAKSYPWHEQLRKSLSL